MQKINAEDKLFINLLDKEIRRHLTEYCLHRKNKSTNAISLSSLQSKSNVIVKDHKRIILKTFHKSSQSENLEQFNDIPLSERQNRRINIAQKTLRYKAQTQQTQRSEFKSLSDELIVPQRVEDVHGRLQTCKEYLQKEQRRLRMIEEQVQKNEYILKELQQELEIIKSNNAIFQKIKHIDQQMYKNQLNSNNHRRVTEELLQFILSIQQKYTKCEQINTLLDEFTDELRVILGE